ncbi:unnamed protein product [Camellia sinensis]
MSSRFSVPASKAARDQSSPAISLAFNTALQRGCHLCEHCGLSAKIDTKVIVEKAERSDIPNIDKKNILRRRLRDIRSGELRALRLFDGLKKLFK